MGNGKARVTLLTLLVLIFLIPISQVAPAQELRAGAKLIGTSPFLFAEAKFWIFAVDVGIGPSSADQTDSYSGYEPSPVVYSFTGKVYPIEIMNFSPYLGFSSKHSTHFIRSNYLGGIEFDFPSERLPVSAFTGAGIDFTEAEGFVGLGWHLGVKYTFSFHN